MYYILAHPFYRTIIFDILCQIQKLTLLVVPLSFSGRITSSQDLLSLDLLVMCSNVKLYNVCRFYDSVLLILFRLPKPIFFQ